MNPSTSVSRGPVTIAFFNNKGGVGKTTLAYHLVHTFADEGKSVLVADFDPQANLTAMFLHEERLEQLFEADTPSTIMSAISPLIRGRGDIAPASVENVSGGIHLLPGDLRLSNFEGMLSNAWGACVDKNEPAFLQTTSFYRIVQNAAEQTRAELVILDVGPNLGAINRAALICADYVVIPLAPDLYSLQGIRNVGPTLVNWREEWGERVERCPVDDIPLPPGTLHPLGYVVLQFGIRDSRPVRAYDRWSQRIPQTYARELLGEETGRTSVDGDSHCLAMLKHYRSLMPLAMEARKPIFHLTAADGASGSHFSAARRCGEDFSRLAERILGAIAQEKEHAA